MRSLPSDCSGGLARASSVLAARFSLVVFLAVLLPGLAWTQTDVVTQHYDVSRSGLNPSEVILTPSNVNSSQFGKLFSQSVDGHVYAQPLYVHNVAIPGKGTHNVVFVETQYDSVYAFDADSNAGADANPLWKVSVIDMAHGAASGATPVPYTVVNCNGITPVYGITGTPTIDVSSNTMYVEATSIENGGVLHRLHALDITTGAEKSPGPVLVNPSVAGTGQGSVNGKITLDPVTTWNRTGMLLMNGTVYLSFGAHCDRSPWHGWLVAYDASTFALKGVFNSTPNGTGGGIWMAAGAGLAADSSGNIYIATGNGTYDGVTEFSDSVVKLGPFNNGRLPEVDWFTPFDQSVLNSHDWDLGSSGVLLLPDQPAGSPRRHLLLAGGKEGTVYVLDRDNLGRFNPNNNSQVWQSFNASPQLRAAPAWWNNNLFMSRSNDNLRAYKFDPLTSMLSSVSSSHSPEVFALPAPTPVVSANGTTNAIVWVLENSASSTGGSTILYAYDATNLANELYNSSQNSARDDPGPALRFAVPIVTNGKVYVGTKTQLSVFGELSLLSSISVNPASVVGGSPSTGTVTLGAPAPSGGVVVTLQSSDTAVATVQGTVTVAANATTATFLVSTRTVTTMSTASISATYKGSTQRATLTVNSTAGRLTVTTTSMPNGTRNAAYSTTLAAAGGTTPYSWSITSGSLPLGLALDSRTGVISGTPTVTGTSNFTVQVKDAKSLTGTMPLSLAINTSSGGGIGLVQENAVQGSRVGSVSVTFPTTNTTGNLILAFVRMSTTSETVTLSDIAGNAYVEAVAQPQDIDGSQVHLFYAKNILGTANTVTARFSSTNNHPWLAIYEYKGLNTSNPLDKTAHAQGGDTAPNSGATPTTTSANELVFAAMGLPASYSGTQAVGSGYSLLLNDTATSPASNESKQVTATGSYTATFNLGSWAYWTAVVATFKQ